MKERIEQLTASGFTAEEAAKIAATEIKRAKQLISEGFAADGRVIARAINETKFARLVAEKRQAGLTVEQAESVATSQCNNDLRVRAEALKSKDSKESSDARAAERTDKEVAAALLAEVAPKTEEAAK